MIAQEYKRSVVIFHDENSTTVRYYNIFKQINNTFFFNFKENHKQTQITSSHTSCLLIPGLKFIIFNSAAFNTPSCVNSIFGLPVSASTLTLRK